ncbi:MAG: hypothetical protein Q9170_007254 [Blastenia crenularia]
MPHVTADDYGPLVKVVTWFLLVATIITVTTRTAMKWALSRKTTFDDVVILAAAALGIGQSIAVTAGSVPNGLGQRFRKVPASQTTAFQKSYYTAVLLYIPCICLSKLAVLFLLRTITPIRTHRRMVVAAGIVTVGWATAAELIIAFQCKLPTPWAIFDGHCIDIVSLGKKPNERTEAHCISQTTFWYSFTLLQLLLDIVLVILPWVVVRRVQMSKHRKVVIIGCFATRLTVVVGVVAQWVCFNSATKSDNIPFHLWPEVVCAQIVQSLSIITACVPYLKPFFDSLESGMIRNDDLRRRGLAYDAFYTPSRSRRSSAPQSSAGGPTNEVIELNTHLDELPRGSINTISGIIPISFRLSGSARQHIESQKQDLTISRISATDGQACDDDSQTGNSEILRKPSMARLLPPRG